MEDAAQFEQVSDFDLNPLRRQVYIFSRAASSTPMRLAPVTEAKLDDAFGLCPVTEPKLNAFCLA